MKKINIKLVTAFFVAVLVASVCIFHACKKEDAIANRIMKRDTSTEKPLKGVMPTELQQLYNQLVIPDFGNITLLNGDILKFESADHYEQVYDALNELCKAWMALFIATYDTGTEEDLDAHIARLGFDERMPLFKFEQKYKSSTITTLLEECVEMEQQWLDRGGNGSGPDYEITNCPVEQTLLSLFYEFCIGDTICQLRPSGYQILIPISKLSCLNTVRNISISELLGRGLEVPGTKPIFPKKIVVADPPVTVIDPNEIDCSVSEYEKKGEIENNYCSGYKYHWSYHFQSCWFPWKNERNKTTVTMTNYKKNKNDKWIKDYGSNCRINFNTDVNTYYYDTKECIVGGGYLGLCGNGLITKVVWKSLTVRDFAEKTELVWDGYSYKEIPVGCYRHNTDASTLTIRHKGINFKIDIKTGGYIVI
jgi:hypothetical protein